MDNNLYLTQELNKKHLRADLAAKLAHLEGQPITLKIIHEARSITAEFLTKVACNYSLAKQEIDLDYIPQGNDLIFVAKNLTTAALIEGFNLYQKQELVTDEFTFWEFEQGTLRKDNKTGAIVFVPAIVYKHIDLSQMLPPKE